MTLTFKHHSCRFFRGRSGSCGFVDYENKLEKQLSEVSEMTTSDLAMSPPVSNPDEDMGGVMFRIEESDTESRGSTATSLDSGVGGVTRARGRRVRTMTECEVGNDN